MSWSWSSTRSVSKRMAYTARAETQARAALAHDPRHPGAIHALAHVLEMQGRFHEGLALLAATGPGRLSLDHVIARRKERETTPA